MQRLQGKVAVIAGGATGIGAACARRYSAEGARVVIGDLNIGAAQQLAASLGSSAAAIHYDAADAASIKALIERAAATFGRIDVLHNNVALTSQAIQSQDTTVTDIPLEISLTFSRQSSAYPMTSRHWLLSLLRMNRGTSRGGPFRATEDTWRINRKSRTCANSRPNRRAERASNTSTA
jgi:NAD(P)-dependent dehydrogenase (short-subunit alcohol dehydrogenase family)